jgi:hypothetical protein
MSYAIFDESYYLANNPDVQAAVNAGAFSSGRQHFEQYGLAEGRVSVSPYYNEQLYLQKYPDVASAVSAGSLSSGLQHYIQFGEAESRSPGAFNEQSYRQQYADVAAAVTAGAFSSGLQHYIQYGQFESNRIGVFTGTTANDTLTGFGVRADLLGIDVQNTIPDDPGTVKSVSQNWGTGEVDILIGGSGRDLFYLGDETEFASAGSFTGSFYVGNGSADYAIIRNFSRGDAIQLAGFSLSFYNLQPVNGSLNISTSAGDLIGVVEGVTSLSPLVGNPNPYTIQIG